MGGSGRSYRLLSLAFRSASKAATRSSQQQVCSSSRQIRAFTRSSDARNNAAQVILYKDFSVLRSSYSDVHKGSSSAQWDLLRNFSAGSNEGSVSVTVPSMGESVNDGNIAAFLKQPGDAVNADDIIAQIETDKVTIDVRTPEAGVLQSLEVKEGDTVTPGTVVAIITKGSAPPPTPPPPAEEKPKETTPAAPKSPPPPPPSPSPKPASPAPPAPAPGTKEGQLPLKDMEQRVPMTRLRKRVATRLKDSQNTFALLTTFNEVDMTNLMQLRSDYKDEFLEKHGVKFGFMSAFVKAAVVALQQNPVVNAVIDGDDIIYRDYYDISIAVGTPKGLVVPVIRRAETLGFSQIEQTINMLGKKARDGSLAIDDMAGGTFTISNGGVYGSLLSTPIVNPPQSAILGMHSIVQRPMVVGGEICARPMMYLALTYDHRLIDGREAVLFLRRIKAVIEDPRRLILDL